MYCSTYSDRTERDMYRIEPNAEKNSHIRINLTAGGQPAAETAQARCAVCVHS